MVLIISIVILDTVLLYFIDAKAIETFKIPKIKRDNYQTDRLIAAKIQISSQQTKCEFNTFRMTVNNPTARRSSAIAERGKSHLFSTVFFYIQPPFI